MNIREKLAEWLVYKLEMGFDFLIQKLKLKASMVGVFTYLVISFFSMVRVNFSTLYLNNEKFLFFVTSLFAFTSYFIFFNRILKFVSYFREKRDKEEIVMGRRNINIFALDLIFGMSIFIIYLNFRSIYNGGVNFDFNHVFYFVCVMVFSFLSVIFPIITAVIKLDEVLDIK